MANRKKRLDNSAWPINRRFIDNKVDYFLRRRTKVATATAPKRAIADVGSGIATAILRNCRPLICACPALTLTKGSPTVNPLLVPARENDFDAVVAVNVPMMKKNYMRIGISLDPFLFLKGCNSINGSNDLIVAKFTWDKFLVAR